jgi:UDP-2,3-diacylglucosamine hydrolase
LHFLDAATRHADALLLPGDIFDAWIGDDIIARAPPWLCTVLQGLTQTARAIPLWLGHGNRDFLMGETLVTHLGAQRLPELARLDTAQGAILLTHGDELCTDDHDYQRFRAMVRNPAWQAQFLKEPMEVRLALAQQMRLTSKSAMQAKSADIMDVNPEAIKALFHQTGIATLIHGHTHRPNLHETAGEGQTCKRWVLSDWDWEGETPPGEIQAGETQAAETPPGRGDWLVIDAQGVHRRTLHGPAPLARPQQHGNAHAQHNPVPSKTPVGVRGHEA